MKNALRTIAALFLTSTLALANGWMTDWEAAKAKAKAENKPILINFTGTDWCGWCIRIEKECFLEKRISRIRSEKFDSHGSRFPEEKTTARRGESAK